MIRAHERVPAGDRVVPHPVPKLPAAPGKPILVAAYVRGPLPGSRRRCSVAARRNRPRRGSPGRRLGSCSGTVRRCRSRGPLAPPTVPHRPPTPGRVGGPRRRGLLTAGCPFDQAQTMQIARPPAATPTRLRCWTRNRTAGDHACPFGITGRPSLQDPIPRQLDTVLGVRLVQVDVRGLRIGPDRGDRIQRVDLGIPAARAESVEVGGRRHSETQVLPPPTATPAAAPPHHPSYRHMPACAPNSRHASCEPTIGCPRTRPTVATRIPSEEVNNDRRVPPTGASRRYPGRAGRSGATPQSSGGQQPGTGHQKCAADPHRRFDVGACVGQGGRGQLRLGFGC